MQFTLASQQEPNLLQEILLTFVNINNRASSFQPPGTKHMVWVPVQATCCNAPILPPDVVLILTTSSIKVICHSGSQLFSKINRHKQQHVLIPTTSNFGLWKYPVWHTTNAGLAIFELPAHLQKAQSFRGTCQPVIFCHENLLISHAATMKTMMNFWTISLLPRKRLIFTSRGISG